MAVRHSTQSPRGFFGSITSDLGGVLLGGIGSDLGGVLGNGLSNIVDGLVNPFLGSSTAPSLSNQATGVSIGQSTITITPTTQGYITSYTVANTDVYISHNPCI